MKVQLYQPRSPTYPPCSGVTIRQIVSTVQSTAGRAVIDFAAKRGLACGGGGSVTGDARNGARRVKTADGRRPSCAPLQRREPPTPGCEGTVVFTSEEFLTDECELAARSASAPSKPWIQLAAHGNRANHAAVLRAFIFTHKLEVLNVVCLGELEGAELGKFATSTLRGALSRRMSKQQPPSILVVDDEPWIREFYRLVLDGYEVLEAENSESALDIAKHGGLEMVITDCERPGKMDGLHFTARMRRDYPTVPILMATGNVFTDFRQKAFRAGVHSFLGKPFGREELLRAVDHVLSNLRYGYTDRPLGTDQSK